MGFRLKSFIFFSLLISLAVLMGCGADAVSETENEVQEEKEIEQSDELENEVSKEEVAQEEELEEGEFDWSDKKENPEQNVGGYDGAIQTMVPNDYLKRYSVEDDEIANIWNTGVHVSEYHNSMQRLNYGEIVDFGPLMIQVEDIYFERINESDIEYSLVIDANYINLVNYPFDINDIFVPIGNGIEFENLEIVTDGHESSVLEPVTEARIKLISTSPSDYSFQNLDNVEYEAVRVETPYSDEGYAMYNSKLE